MASGVIGSGSKHKPAFSPAALLAHPERYPNVTFYNCAGRSVGTREALGGIAKKRPLPKGVYFIRVGEGAAAGCVRYLVN